MMLKKFLSTCVALGTLLSPVLSVSAESPSPTPLTSGRLIKASATAVYWYTGDRRYVFPNEETFYTWFSPYDFARIVRISDEQMMSIPIGGNVTYRPGSRLVKIAADVRVYAVDGRATLRPINSESVARDLYGNNWAQFIDEIPEPFFVNYEIGTMINNTRDYRPPVNYTPSDLLR